jgi:hypothetical protein
VAIDLSELSRVQPEFSSHLNNRMRQIVALSGLDPFLEIWRNSLGSHGSDSIAGFATVGAV